MVKIRFMWTRFFDMYSGGTRKTEYESIFIELPEKEATEYFKEKFGIDPDYVTCDCCGSDFSVYEVSKEPIESKGFLIIRNSEIL